MKKRHSAPPHVQEKQKFHKRLRDIWETVFVAILVILFIVFAYMRMFLMP